MENARAFGSFRASLRPRDASKMMIALYGGMRLERPDQPIRFLTDLGNASKAEPIVKVTIHDSPFGATAS